MNLRERAKQFSVSLELMDGREKDSIDNIIGKVVTIKDFGFMKDENDKLYVAFVVEEHIDKFYFGGQVLTENLLELEKDGYTNEIKKDGLPVLLEKKRSKKNNVYTTVSFYPENK